MLDHLNVKHIATDLCIHMCEVGWGKFVGIKYLLFWTCDSSFFHVKKLLNVSYSPLQIGLRISKVILYQTHTAWRSSFRLHA